RRRHTRFSRDWSSDVCSSDLTDHRLRLRAGDLHGLPHCSLNSDLDSSRISGASSVHVDRCTAERMVRNDGAHRLRRDDLGAALADEIRSTWIDRTARRTSPTEAEEARNAADRTAERRSEEHTSELQSRENLVCRL